MCIRDSYHILSAGGFKTGGTNFDAKLRRQSIEPVDLIAAHVGAMDICAHGLKVAEAIIEDGGLDAKLQERYEDWSKPEALKMLRSDLEEITKLVLEKNINPQPRSGNQEILENYVNRFL